MNTAEKFLQHCRMTCLGGSERGTCDCLGASDCVLRHHPLYTHYRNAAIERLRNLMIVQLTKKR